MSDKKISQLTNSSPITGAEEVPVVQSGSTVKTTINAIKAFFDTIYTTTSAVASQISSALSGYVNTSGLTANYIPKASDSDTLANSIIQDDGSRMAIGTSPISGYIAYYTNTAEEPIVGLYNQTAGGAFNEYGNSSTGTAKMIIGVVSNYGFLGTNGNIDLRIRTNSVQHSIIKSNGDWGINTLTPIARIHAKGSNSTGNPTDLCALFVNSSNAEILKLRNDRAIIIDSLTANRILELDANKVVISAAKNSGYNLALGTTAGTVLEGNRITQTITNGVTDRAPSEDAVFDALALKVDSNDTRITDKLITLNAGGSIGSGIGVGFEIEAGGSVNAYIKSNAAQNGYSFKSVDTSYFADILFTNFTANRSYSLPNANGTLALISQTITNGVTDKAPSEDAVFDALALKVDSNDTRLTQAVRTIYKDFTAGAALTGTTSITLINSALISANTVAVGNEVEIYARAQRSTNTGTASQYLYYNTSASLSGATLMATTSLATAYFVTQRRLFVKASNDAEILNSSANVSLDTSAATTSVTSLNINWTVNQYIIQAFQNAANGDSTTSRAIIIKLS